MMGAFVIMRKFTILLICIMLVVLSLGAVLVIYWMQDIPAELAAEASLTASVSDAGGIDTSSIFPYLS